MSKGDKFVDLTRFLKNKDVNETTLTFEEIKNILGFLPDSCYKYVAAWANDPVHSMSYGWMNAGYFSKDVSLKEPDGYLYKTRSYLF